MSEMVFLIVLGSRPNNPIIFNADKVKSPDHIKSAFREDVAPTFVFEENCDEKRKEIGRDDLKPNVIYVWRIKKEIWEEKELVQNALFCSQLFTRTTHSHI